MRVGDAPPGTYEDGVHRRAWRLGIVTILRSYRTCIRPAFLLSAMVMGASSASAQPVRVETVEVAGGGEIDGPAYDFRVGRFEVRNDEFVAFLNDALANPENERGQYIYVDLDTGDVYVNTAQIGEQGNGAGGRAIQMFTPAAAGQIEFVNGAFQIAAGAGVDYAVHPVTGASWYGAVKFCNWLTVQVGIDPDQRCYTEAPAGNLDGWHPVTITDAGWRLRDLTAAERETLVTEYLGYRLAMDDGEAVTSAYNEWYKAAAYDPAAPDVVRTRPFGPDVAADHWIFAFGRDLLEWVDANVLDSGDPFEDLEPATAPVGFFDGISLLADLTVTRDTDNPYGIYDLSGNVWEWVQDQDETTDRRRYRGGSWNHQDWSCRVARRGCGDPGRRSGYSGFRVCVFASH